MITATKKKVDNSIVKGELMENNFDAMEVISILRLQKKHIVERLVIGNKRLHSFITATYLKYHLVHNSIVKVSS